MNRIQNEISRRVQKIVNPVNLISKNQRIVQSLLKWFSENARDLPWRNTLDPYAIWVSEIMLQQTQVKTVIPYWERWTRELPTIESLANAPLEKILKLWEGLGYYTRVRNLQKAAQVVCEKHHGRFPEHFDEIIALPGIGRYTGGAICSIAFNQPQPILDGNVVRVLTRVFGISGNPRDKNINEQLWGIAGELVDQSSHLKQDASCSHLNQSLMELGALICTPRQTNCVACPVQKLCVARLENRVAELPNLEKRKAPTKRRFVAFIVEKNKRFFVQKRPAKVVNADFWEFPNVEINDPKSIPAHQDFRIGPGVDAICTIKHSITRYRMTLDAFPATLSDRKKLLAGKWLRISEMQTLAFSSAHRQILERLVEMK